MRICLISLSLSLLLTSNILVAEEEIRTHGGVITVQKLHDLGTNRRKTEHALQVRVMDDRTR